MISTVVNGRQELLTSDSFTYEVKRSVLSRIGEIIEHEETTVEKLLNELDATKTGLSAQIKDIASKKTNMNDMNLFGINKRFLQDAYGFYSINFFGDSITQGYNSSNHYEKSYMSLLRKSFQKEYSTTNVGFVNVHPTGYYQTLTTFGEWTNTQSYNYLGSQVIQSTQINATITIIPKFKQKYFSICYEQNTTNGAFDIYVS